MVSAIEMLQDGTEFIKSNVGSVALGTGALISGLAVGVVATKALSSPPKRKRRKSKRTTRRTRKKRNSRRRTRKTPRTAGKRRDTSHKRIRYTKKGQPYVIMASGKARFIKKKGAKLSHRRKGGRY